jgi:hypothetical protein
MILDEPVKARDHLLDSLRYAVHTIHDDIEHGVDLMIF